tara:strand:- start:1502 stop:2989 length:1488 start_codon:yes stop_codon:yes gene_type:complete
MALYDILAQGMIDKALTANPQSTFWRSTWKRHTRFSLESFTQPFNTACAFGQESQLLLNRNGDMVYFLYLKLQLPGLVACDPKEDNCPGLAAGGQFPVYMDNGGACAPCEKADTAAYLEYLQDDFNDLSDDQKIVALKEAKDQWRRKEYGAGTELSCCTEGDADCPDTVCPELGDTWCHWVNDVGHFAIQKAKLVIGGQQVDQLLGTFLMLWEELTGKSGRRLLEMTGRRYTRAQLCCDSREKKTLYVPLPFFFTLTSGSALPLASLAYHGVQINVEFEQFTKLVVVSRSGVVVRNAQTGLGLTNADLKAELEVTYCFLDNPEREKFSSSHFEQLMVQTQHYFHSDSRATCRIPLSFNHPTLEILFAVRRQCQERCNNWSNLSGLDGRDPIENAELLLNSTPRFGKKDALFYRCVQPYQHHSNVPELFLYTMCFALNPENSSEPSGSCNLSRIDHVELKIEVQPALANENYTIMVFSRSWNIMRYREGVAGAAYQ